MQIKGQADAYHDLAALDKLRAQARSTPDEAIDQVAKQFEGMFLNMVLKSMREANLADGLFSSSAEETHLQMYDQQLALEIASGDGLGFAKSLRAQLGAAAGVAVAAEAGLPVSAEALVKRAPIPRFRGVAEAPTTAPAVTPDTGPATAATPTTPVHFDNPGDFVTALWPSAQRVAARLGVQPEVLLAQAAHETGWGQHIPQHADGGSSHNLFGIKAGASWSGERVSKPTFEVVDGVPRREIAAFRAYPSFDACLDDYADLIGGRDRYAAARRDAADPAGYLQGLQQGGYATDPAYAERVLAVLEGERFQAALNGVRAPVAPAPPPVPENLTQTPGMETAQPLAEGLAERAPRDA